MKIVYVEWTDAAGTEKYHKDVVVPKEQGLGLQVNYSVGIVVKEEKEYLSLALSLSESGWYRDIINIPKINIITYLKLLKESK